MKTFKGYLNGINLGHWISQYPQDDKENRWNNYIGENDFKRIKDWGLDHVRVPVDYFLFESDQNPGVYSEDGLKYVDFALECAKKYGLNMVLDLHHAPGFSFTNKFDEDKNNLFSSETQQERYINIWRMFSHRYINEGDNLVFELLNEMVLSDSKPWDDLWQKCAKAVHEINENRTIIIGSNLWNDPNQLKYLTVWDNERIVYNFHTYAPLAFTHQRAGWEKHLKEYQKSVTWPLDCNEHREFLKEHFGDEFDEYEIAGKDYLYQKLKGAIEFIQKNDRALYCGEYGVISFADLQSTLNWMDDMTSILLEFGIGRAFWSYRGFADLTNKNNELVNEDYLKLVARSEIEL